MLRRVVWGPFSVLILLAASASSSFAADVGDNPPFQWPGQQVAPELCVAVIDSGIDYLHLDLGPSLLGSAGTPQGWDFIDEDGLPYDVEPPKVLPSEMATQLGLPQGTKLSPDKLQNHPPQFYFQFPTFFETVAGHGSHVAGIALKSSGTGCVLPVRIEFNTENTFPQLIRAIQYIAARGVRVVNMSFSYSLQGMGLKEIEQVAKLKTLMLSHPEMLFVTISHNQGWDLVAKKIEIIPGSLDVPNKIVVAAVDSTGQLWPSSNIGEGLLDVFAPGVDISSAHVGGGTILKSGTSMASPFVAGVAVQQLQIYPGVGTELLKSLVLGNAVDRVLTRSEGSEHTLQFHAKVLGI